MADVARYYLEESGQLGELPAHLQNYIDYAAYGRDMELDGDVYKRQNKDTNGFLSKNSLINNVLST